MSNTTEHYLTLPAIYPNTTDLTTIIASNVTNGTLVWDSPPYHNGLWILLVVIHVGLPILAIAFCHFMGPNLNPELASYRKQKKKVQEGKEAKSSAKRDQPKAVKSNVTDVDKEKKSSKTSDSNIEVKKSDLQPNSKMTSKSMATCFSKDTAPPQIIKMIASDESAGKYGSAKENSLLTGIRKSHSASAQRLRKPHPITKIPAPSPKPVHEEVATPRSAGTLSKQISLPKVLPSIRKQGPVSKLSSGVTLSKDSYPSILSTPSDATNSSKVIKSRSSTLTATKSQKSKSSTKSIRSMASDGKSPKK